MAIRRSGVDSIFFVAVYLCPCDYEYEASSARKFLFLFFSGSTCH